MASWVSVIVSLLALGTAATTAWLTLFQRGKLRMTQPTVIFFGPDGGPGRGKKRPLKVFLRTLLFSPSRRGQTVESLHVNLQRGEYRQNFSIWVYGDGPLARGSGIFVPSGGVACNHHFLLPADGAEFKLLAGDYRLRIYAKNIDAAAARELASIRLQISDVQAEQLKDDHAGIYFDWGPDQQAYHAHVDMKPPNPMNELLGQIPYLIDSKED
jgi:hypothetical protein